MRVGFIAGLVTSILLMNFSGPLVAADGPPPRNIILFIGDGMGLAQVTAARLDKKGPLNMEKLEVLGLLTTHSSSHLVTDSAAAATAMASGVKTFNGAIGVDPEKKPVLTVLEQAEKQGLKTGLVVTCTLTHATPACFVVHAPSRNLHTDIAEQIAEADVDVMIGWGREYFLPKSAPGSLRKDELDLLAVIQKKKRVMVDQPQGLKDLQPQPEGLAAIFPDPPGGDKTPPRSSRGIGLAEQTATAIKWLESGENGFFLMVEGSQIDWNGHSNNFERLIPEMHDFDEAVGVGLEFARRSKNTLMIVTADHETGGLGLIEGEAQGRTIKPGYLSKSHTGIMVPLWAEGPGAVELGGVHDNTEVARLIFKCLKQREGR